jgi:alpha-beta hydrolase superfamily lysophospholipase
LAAAGVIAAAIFATPAGSGFNGLEGPFGSGAEQVWLLRPAGTPRAVVVFGHGWKSRPPASPSAWVAQFRPWLDHLVATGDAVIFPRYQLGGDNQGPARVLSCRKGLRVAFTRLDAQNIPIVAAGYSYGASLALTYAANARRWGFRPVAAVDSIFPAGPIPGSPLPRLPPNTRVLIQVGDRDTQAGAAGADAFWRWLASHPASRKRYVVVHSGSGLIATHAAPKLTTAAARRAFWSPLDALVDGA